MSNRDNRDTSKQPVTDETATRDTGGAFGGSAGPLESREEREDYGEQGGFAATQDRADALSQPPPTSRAVPAMHWRIVRRRGRACRALRCPRPTPERARRRTPTCGRMPTTPAATPEPTIPGRPRARPPGSAR